MNKNTDSRTSMFIFLVCNKYFDKSTEGSGVSMHIVRKFKYSGMNQEKKLHQEQVFNLIVRTSLSAVFLPNSSPFSITLLSASGRTFQNSLTNSKPFRLLFCKISFARYRKETCFSGGVQWNCLFHISTTCLALFLWNIHQCDRASLC